MRPVASTVLLGLGCSLNTKLYPNMPKRDYIIDEIRRVAEKVGRPPGRQVFERETGIRKPEWYGIHFRSWGDALREAGYEPNERQGKFSSEQILRKYAEAIRHFGRIPAEIDIRMYSRERKGFPVHTTFSNHFGNKSGLIAALTEWVRKNDEFSDLMALLPEPEETDPPSPPTEGFVYLLKSGNYYKIGRSNELERRVKQISVSLPEEVSLEHAIRTDDPPGIEAYWHRRFSERRAGGEWFHLTVADLRAFKRHKFQ